jgi:hypothetical protein
MKNLIRFKTVHIDSSIIFSGRRKKSLTYLVSSMALVPLKKTRKGICEKPALPEIFWQ